MSFLQRFKPIRLQSLSSRRFYTTQTPRKLFTWKSNAVLAITTVGLCCYFYQEKEKLKELQKVREKEKIKSYGKPNIGTRFELYNCNQDKVTSSDDLQGQFHMIYFGFTHCPDICPEELDKMAEVTDQLDPQLFVPVFITCDPLRDTAKVVKEYVKDFHPRLIGFTGDPAELKRVARSFRVYSYTPPDVKAEDDYLVDHSIFLYLMDPQGKFIDCYSRDTTAEEVYQSVQAYISEYRKEQPQ